MTGVRVSCTQGVCIVQGRYMESLPFLARLRRVSRRVGI
jgi:hypothetical protein